MQKYQLGDLITLSKGKKPKRMVQKPLLGFSPYVDIQAFETGKIDNYTDGDKCVECNDRDLLIVCDGSRSGLVGKAINGYVGSTLARIDVVDGVDKDYLFYFIQSKYMLLNKNVKGTGTPHLKQDLLKSFELFVPLLDKQKEIVSQIEKQLSQLENAVETLKQTKQQLEIYRQAILKEIFSYCDNVVEIQSVCKYVTDGDHIPPPKSKQGIPFIMISNIVENTIDWNNTAFVGKEYYDSIGDKRTPQKGDVLYTVTGSYGIPVLVDFEKKFCFQRHIALLRPNEKINQEFLYYALQNSSVYEQASKKATGTAQKTVGLTVLRTIKIPFTESLKIQEQIVLSIKSKLLQCKKVEETVNQSLQQAEALRQSILKRAFIFV